MLRRSMEAGARTLPVVGLFALPLSSGSGHLFAWADHARVEADHLLHHKAPYLNPTFFISRTVFAVVLFSFFAWRLTRLSESQDRDGDAGNAVAMRRFSAVGLLVFVVVSSFARLRLADVARRSLLLEPLRRHLPGRPGARRR